MPRGEDRAQEPRRVTEKDALRAQAAKESVNAFDDLCGRLAHIYEQGCFARRRQTTVVLVLGAAASGAVQMPTWDERLKRALLKEILKLIDESLFFEHAHEVLGPYMTLWDDEDDAETRRRILIEKATIEQICGVATRFGAADRRIREVFTTWFTRQGAWTSSQGPGAPPLAVYELIAHLVKHGVVHHIVTFNFDELLDAALDNELGSEGYRRIYSGFEALEIHDPPKPTLVKIHGTVSAPETMRFSYRDVWLLGREMRAHLELVLGLGQDTPGDLAHPQAAPPRRHLCLLSLGYAWRDRNIANWLRGKRRYVQRLTVVRRQSAFDEEKQERRMLLPELLRDWGEGAPVLEAISTADLAANTELHSPPPVELDHFCWALTRQVFERVKPGTPVQPIARHLLLSSLLRADLVAEDERTSAAEVEAKREEELQRRARTEIILHLAKAKGFIHTASTPTSPRVRGLIVRRRKRTKLGHYLTAQDFIDWLGLRQLMHRSAQPEAWDTYFAFAKTRNQFLDALTAALLVTPDAEQEIEEPDYQKSVGIMVRKVSRADFVRRSLAEILESPDIEVLSQPNPELDWSFVRPVRLSSFGHFSQHVASIVQKDWTHLIAVTESLRWLDYPWIAQALEQNGTKRTILALLPSVAGLEEWRLRDEYLETKPKLRSGTVIHVARIPWWHHNRHVILGVRLHPKPCEMLGGVFYSRPFRSTGIAPIALDEPRDQAKLLGVLLRYCQSQRMQKAEEAGPEFRRQLRAVVGALIARGGPLDEEMKRFLKTLHSKVAWART